MDTKLERTFLVSPESSAPLTKIAETVAALIEGLPQVVSNLAPTHGRLRENISDALVRRNVPEGQISWPRMDVAVPAIEALRYSELQEQFANLIASSMDQRTAYAVLPAYVEVLKQLSSDEIELLKNVPQLGRFAPIVDIVYVFPNEQIISGHRNILPTALAGACQVSRNIPQYVDNLCRLSLISRPASQEADDLSYKTLLRQSFIKDIMKAAPPKSAAGIDRAVIGVTDFGEQFRKACLG